jgi:FAD/FMN-containing dehydrogenase
MTGSYGQGADNLLEATVVTPKGEVMVANECRNSDLIWALRGGGGGTFGVLTHLTMKAYPTPNVTMAGFALSQKNRTKASDFWKAAAEVAANLPDLKAQGMSGYLTASGPAPLYLGGALFVYNAPNGTIESLLDPLDSKLGRYNASVTATYTTTFFPRFIDLFHNFNLTDASAGGATARTTRLVPAGAFTEDLDLVAEMFERIGPQAEWIPVSCISSAGLQKWLICFYPGFDLQPDSDSHIDGQLRESRQCIESGMAQGCCSRHRTAVLEGTT